jgi:predicted nucleic acid-binding protein
MSVLVVDASVAVEWIGSEARADAAIRIFDERNDLHAPDILFLETDNALCKWLRRGTINEAHASHIRDNLAQLPIRVHSSADLRMAAFGLAISTRQSVYDCLYLALAVFLDAKMVTADRKAYEGIALSHWASHILWFEHVPQ